MPVIACDILWYSVISHACDIFDIIISKEYKNKQNISNALGYFEKTQILKKPMIKPGF